jgi:hypothetical protein
MLYAHFNIGKALCVGVCTPCALVMLLNPYYAFAFTIVTALLGTRITIPHWNLKAKLFQSRIYKEIVGNGYHDCLKFLFILKSTRWSLVIYFQSNLHLSGGSLLFVLLSFLAIKMYVLRFVFLITPLMSSNFFFLRFTTYHFQHHLEKASVISGGLQINVNYFESIWQETIVYSLIWKEILSSHGNHFQQFLYISSTEIIRNTNRRTYILMAKKDKRTNNKLQSTIRKTKDWEINAKLTENRSELTCFGKVRSSWYSSDTRLWYKILNLDIWSDTCYHTMLCMFWFIYLHSRKNLRTWLILQEYHLVYVMTSVHSSCTGDRDFDPW